MVKRHMGFLCFLFKLVRCLEKQKIKLEEYKTRHKLTNDAYDMFKASLKIYKPYTQFRGGKYNK